MKRWAWVVVLLYAVVLVSLTLPFLSAAFHPLSENFDMERGLPGLALQVYASGLYWVIIVCLLVAQWALLLVPVKVESRRPISKRTVLVPVIAAGFLLALLIAGFVFVVAESIARDNIQDPVFWVILAVFVTSWFWWATAFSLMSRKVQPQGLIARITRFLFVGSILELLVAVPAHILARSRHYCCAGFHTFIGLAFGLAVMLVSFGPAVYVLFVNRWRKIRPSAASQALKP